MGEYQPLHDQDKDEHYSVPDEIELRRGCYPALNGIETPCTTHHIKHCLAYLRQSIMCHGDTNLEYREEDEETGEVGTSGYGTHQCQNFAELYDFAEKWKVWKGKRRPEQERITEEKIPGRVINYGYVSSRGDPVPFITSIQQQKW
ncbi:hypothetical protein OEA41_002357 [Lepraria neglecta]|uniref:Uncharacterized protein n=1 Tax=Lepraria neglecta TaxID=209136 RepID=A0AAE0DMB6_9LECA|nr:hypothetical protein OEA41_002357 [Lepraria neglecta]